MTGDLLESLLFTDLYELKMAQAYGDEGMRQPAVFELFFRELPATRSYAVAAGLADLLDCIEHLQISDDEIKYLRQQREFSEDFLRYLSRFRFSGDIYAMAEGTPVFPNEPIVQVIAPITEAQLLETLVLNQIHLQTVAASKAARIVFAAAGRVVVDFGARRAHGSDAAMKVARTSYLVGGSGTSLVSAGHRYGIPIFGTMAHSYIQSHPNELQAFEHFARLYPETTLLVDTYDTLRGVQHVIDMARRLNEAFHVRAIRLDSGDLDQLARKSRQMLDEAGLTHVRIFASSSLDEYAISTFVGRDTPIDGFGVGTRLAVSEDAPTVDMAYKLVEYGGRPTLKLSSHKELYPCRKQLWREYREGVMAQDRLGRFDESLPGEPLLQPVMQGGRRLAPSSSSLAAMREQAMGFLNTLPASLRRLDGSDAYRAAISQRLKAERQALAREIA